MRIKVNFMFITGLRNFELPQFPATTPQIEPPRSVNGLHQAIKNFVFTEEKIVLTKIATLVCTAAAVIFAGILSPVPYIVLGVAAVILNRYQNLTKKNLHELKQQQSDVLPLVQRARNEIDILKRRLEWMQQMQPRIEDGEKLLERLIQANQRSLELFERTCLVQIPS